MSFLRLIVINAGLIDLNRDTEVRRWNSRCIFARACILTVEQLFQLCLQILGTTVAFCCFKCIHGGTIETPKRTQKLRWRPWKLKGVGPSREGNALARYSCA